MLWRRTTGGAVFALAVLITVMLVATPTAAATVDVGADLHGGYDACIGKIRGAGMGWVVDQLDRSGNVIKIRSTSGDSNTEKTPWWMPGSTVETHWNPDQEGKQRPDGTHGETIAEDRCATLVHEMTHASAFDQGTQYPVGCGVQDASGQWKFLEVDPFEAHAVAVENQYRANAVPKLPQRQTHIGQELPPPGKKCESPPGQPTGPPAGGGCNVSAVGVTNHACANSNGDPHLVTLDGLRYDFQAAGEFLLSRASGGDLEIQVRQAAFPGSRTVSVNSAAAVNVAGDRVGVYASTEGPVLRVNGATTPLSLNALLLPHGGTVVAYPDGTVTAIWPDGAAFEARPIGPYGISVSVRVPEARRGTMEGLLGTYDGDKANDLAIRGGAVLAQPPTFDALYSRYADSWRIKQDQSLFDYAPGENTDTFTDRSMPTRPIATADLPNRATAEQICRQAGVTDPQTLDGCILDVGLTGQIAFAADAVATQRLVAPGPTPVPGAPAQPGKPIKVGENPMGVAFAPDGRRAYVAQLNGPLAVIDVPTATVTGTVPMAGAYDLVVSPDGKWVYASGLKGVYVIDTTAGKVTQEVEIGKPSDSEAIAISPDGMYLYTSDSYSGTVTVIETATYTIKGTIKIGAHPAGLAVSRDGTRLYVAFGAEGKLAVIDVAAKTVIARFVTGFGASAVAVTPDGRKAYVTNPYQYTISVVDTAGNKVVKTLESGGYPSSAAVTPDGKWLYTVSNRSSEVRVVDTVTDVVAGDPIKVGADPRGLAISPDSKVIYVASASTASVTVLAR